MEHRTLGRTGRDVSVVGLGTWQLGADWGDVSEATAFEVLEAAVETGVDFFDTADVYGDGRSEQFIGRFIKDHPDILVATKMGRRVEQVPENYTIDNFRAWNDRSRRNLGVDTLDLVQLHCPPTPVYSTDAVFDALDAMVEEGRVENYAVSVETREEALTAIARPGVASVQIILNMLRLEPARRGPARRPEGRGRHHRPGPAGQRSPLRQVRRRARPSRRTTTATTTATAPPSTSARPSRASTTRRAWRRSAAWRRWSPRAPRWPSSRCAGSSTSRV